MKHVPELASIVHYQGQTGGACWEGRHVADPKRFASFMRQVVRPRVADEASAFEPDLRGLATTGMATELVERLLHAVPEPQGWEIGEALAECALENDSGREVHWPWNTVRDRRTPRASLPGTDLVGFLCQGDTVLLLFGEVKTSSDTSSPPHVMHGGTGMAWQLDAGASRLEIQRSLLQWLHARCLGEPYRGLYKEAVSRYLASDGKELLIVGVLLRDTPPNEADLQRRGKALAKRLGAPTRVELIAWYLPVPIADWPGLLQEEAP
jgi:hypothetical protein